RLGWVAPGPNLFDMSRSAALLSLAGILRNADTSGHHGRNRRLTMPPLTPPGFARLALIGRAAALLVAFALPAAAFAMESPLPREVRIAHIYSKTWTME